MRGRPVLALTMGDPAGIGPEIALAAARNSKVRRVCRPLLIGSRDVFCHYGWSPAVAPVLDPGVECRVRLGRPTAQGGAASFAAVRLAVRLAQGCSPLRRPDALTCRPYGGRYWRRGCTSFFAGIGASGLALGRKIDGIVTAPISKEMWHAAGVPYPDHTDYLKEATGTSKVAMMLVCGDLYAVLVTRHVPLREAVRQVKADAVVEAATLAYQSLKNALGISKPKLGLCALNPHAGENDLLGVEERRELLPAVRRLRRRGIKISNPLPADSAWARHRAGEFDALVSLFHDQALIPLKVIDRFKIVNWTIGIPFIRTSPGHGTAFDIAGRKRANPDAMIAAALLAARLTR